MPKFNTDWTVQPHGRLEALEEGLLTVPGEIVMPLGRFPRRMTVIGLKGGRVAIWSAVPLSEPQMKEIEAMGEVAFLIVPGVAHRLDVQAWKARYPKAKVLCAPGAKAAVEEVIAVDATADILDDPDVTLETAPGIDEREAVLWVRRGGRTTLVINDMIANVRHPHGLGAHIMARLMGFGVKRPQMPKVGKKLFLKDGPKLAGAFRAWAKTPGLARIVVSHGDVIEADPAGVLKRMAAELEG